MSVLLGHIKAFRSLAKAIDETCEQPMQHDLASALYAAADDLEVQMRAECSGDDRPPAHAPRKGRPPRA